MRWEALFTDLAAQAEAAEAAELDAEVIERTRAELGRVRLVDRLRAQVGASLTVGTVAGPTARRTGRITAVGPDWLLLATAGAAAGGEGQPGEALVPLAAVLWVEGLSTATAAAGGEGRVAARLDLRSALRGLVRDRAPVGVVLRDSAELTGVLDRVAADHVDLATVAPGEDRRRGAVRRLRTLPLPALAVITRR